MITVLAGENSFGLRTELAKLRETFVAEHGDFAVEQLDGAEVSAERIREAVTSLPFLATHKLVIVEQPGTNTAFAESIETLVEDIPETTTVILVEPKLDKRGKYYKWLKAHTDFREHTPLDERGLAAWACEYAKEQGGTLGRPEATYLIQRIGTNQLRVSHEIEKLVLTSGTISKQTIDTMTEPTPQTKIFDLLDAAFAGHTARALEVYDEQRAQKVDPLEILAMIGWQLRQIALAKTSKGHDLIREGKLSSYGAQKAQHIANRITIQDLQKLVAELTELDVRSKSSALDLDSALRVYILGLHQSFQY